MWYLIVSIPDLCPLSCFESDERIEIEKGKLQFELKMKALELQGKYKPKSLLLDSSKTFDVAKHIRLVPPFQEKEVE